jgi:hypothetical protein
MIGHQILPGDGGLGMACVAPAIHPRLGRLPDDAAFGRGACRKAGRQFRTGGCGRKIGATEGKDRTGFHLDHHAGDAGGGIQRCNRRRLAPVDAYRDDRRIPPAGIKRTQQAAIFRPRGGKDIQCVGGAIGLHRQQAGRPAQQLFQRRIAALNAEDHLVQRGGGQGRPKGGQQGHARQPGAVRTWEKEPEKHQSDYRSKRRAGQCAAAPPGGNPALRYWAATSRAPSRGAPIRRSVTSDSASAAAPCAQSRSPQAWISIGGCGRPVLIAIFSISASVSEA